MTSTVTGRIQPHNQRPAATWSSGGAAYDRISYGIADSIEHAVLRLAPASGERILDLCTGTGWTSRVVARRGARVTGVDIAEGLLDAARVRAAAEHLAIDYRLGDAEDLPFDDGAFDAVISTCGVMFATHPDAAARELTRVTRRGGRIVLTTWTPDSTVAGMFQLMRRYLPPPPADAPPSPFEWGRVDRLRERLGSSFNLGFERGVSYYREPDCVSAWDTFSTGYGPTRTLAAALDDERRAALRRDFIAFHEEYVTDLGVTVPREYILTHGIRL